jgi:surface protein
LSNAFITSANNFTVPNYLPSNITNISSMFSWCNRFNQPLNHWNTSNITNMENTFGCCFDFNQSLDNWDVSNELFFYSAKNDLESVSKPQAESNGIEKSSIINDSKEGGRTKHKKRITQKKKRNNNYNKSLN